MGKMTYHQVFSVYEKPFAHKLARKAYSFYRNYRLKNSKHRPLKEHELYMFEEHHFHGDNASQMPVGYNRELKTSVDGEVNLKYLDLFDFLPKEDIDSFRKKLHKFAIKNKKPLFSMYLTKEDEDRIKRFGRYVDGWGFSNLHTIEFINNDYLAKYAPQITISIRNLSSSFLVVKYRFYISKEFNGEFNKICKNSYAPFSDVSKQYNIPWYKPWKFGRSMYTGDDARQAAVYNLISSLKWAAYTETKKWFDLGFCRLDIFPPSFETYSTNILPDGSTDNMRFWNSIGMDYHPDYSLAYNACVSWTEKLGDKEGINLKAFCGGKYSNVDSLPEIAEHDLSDIYGVYMTASCFRKIAERDIELCNKWISKSIRKAKSSLLLKTRALVERKMYYSYRFMSEFSGKSIDYSDAGGFQNQFSKKGSITENTLKNVSKSIAITKAEIDHIIKLLNDAAEYESSKSNLKIQRWMMVITLLSIVVAILALANIKIDFVTVFDVIKSFFK